MVHIHRYAIIALVVCAFFVRLYHFTYPIADWHSWRQADTSAVSRNFVKLGFDILHPRFDDLSNVPSGKDNPQGYRFVEFPIYNILQAGSFVLFGFLSLEEWGRMVSIAASLGSIYFLYLIVKRQLNQTAAIFVAFFFAFVPFNIYYSRTILPDPSMVCAMLGGIYFFSRAIDKKKGIIGKYFFISMLLTAVAFLLKPYALFFTLPMVYLAWQSFGIRSIRMWQFWIFFLVTVLPLVLWRQWMQQFPEGIPANSWLFNGNGIRFRPSFFRWLGYERVIKLISGYVGIIFLLSSIVSLIKIKNRGFFLSFLVSTVLYMSVFATGNVQHDYYQILIMPTLALCYGLGAYALWIYRIKQVPLSVNRTAVTIIIVGMLFFGWQQIKDYYNINNPAMLVAGKAVDTMTPKDAKILALYDGDTTLLYQTNRQGWASFEKDLPIMITMGASYLLLTNPKEQDLGLAKEYKIIKVTPEYLLIDLKQKP